MGLYIEGRKLQLLNIIKCFQAGFDYLFIFSFPFRCGSNTSENVVVEVVSGWLQLLKGEH